MQLVNNNKSLVLQIISTLCQIFYNMLSIIVAYPLRSLFEPAGEQNRLLHTISTASEVLWTKGAQSLLKYQDEAL